MTESHLIDVTPRPCWVAGVPESGARTRTVRHPYDGTDVADITVPDPAQVERAVASAAAIAGPFRDSSAHLRAAALEHTAQHIAQRAEEIAETVTAESGKPLMWAHAEVSQAVSTFRYAAEEARRFVDGIRRSDPEQAGAGRLTVIRQRARGPVLAITPFSFPLSLVADALAAALAVGAPVLVKPASATPLSALLLGEILADTGLPAGAFSILPLSRDEMGALVADERLPVISFAGSPGTAWSVRDAAPRKQVLLRPDGHSVAIICPDWTDDEDLDTAARRIATLGTYQAGQYRGAVRRVIVHRAVADRFVTRLVDAVGALCTGDPFDPEVEVGPLVNEEAAERVEEHINDALRAGGKALISGDRVGSSVPPTVLTDVPADARVVGDEMFGPVLVVSAADSVDAACDQANDAEHRRAGVFTHDVRTAFRAAAALRAAEVVVGEVVEPGTGPEHVRSAMLDYCEDQTMQLIPGGPGWRLAGSPGFPPASDDAFNSSETGVVRWFQTPGMGT